MRLNFYTPDELLSIVERGARVLGFDLTEDGAREIAAALARHAAHRRAAAQAGARFRRRRQARRRVDAKIADAALTRLEVDARGLDAFDRRYLTLIAENFGGGPVGIETIAAALGEARDAIEEIVEPYLMQQGFVQRTPRGRVLARPAYGHLGLTAPPQAPAQTGLFAGDDDDDVKPLKGLGRFEGKAHILPISVYYEDTDLSGVVYHANYLRFMERGRTEFFRLAGISKMAELEERRAHRLGDPLASTCDYHRPARLDDAIDGPHQC